MMHAFPARCGLVLLLLTALLPIGTGCKPEPQITSYQVPKPESVETPVLRPTGGGMPGLAAGGSSVSPENLAATAPEGWSEKPAGSFVLKAWEVVDGDERLDVTISLAGGDMTQNMNRWRGQIGLAPASDADIAAALKPLEVNGEAGKFIEMHQPEDAADRQSIMGVVVPVGDQMWFVKLRGSTKLAEREKERFQAFAQTMKW